MPSERFLRQIDRFLDQAEEAATNHEWARVADAARAILAIDDQNEDAETFRRIAEANLNALIAADPSSPPAPNPVVEQPESFVSGRYQVRRFLGEGGKKRVFLAHDELLDRDVAFALIKADGLDDTGRQRITREAQAMGRMGAHPHIVSIFDLGEEQGAPYIVTELMGGGDVEGELERSGGPLELTRALEVAKCVASGLAFAHGRGIVHRDLKPGNVWLTSEGVAKIGDFGLAVAEGRSRLTQHGMMVGTYAYMPPEQALGGEVTARSDLYSLGAMLYELVTGKPPFEADDPTAVISQHLNAEPVAPSWRTERCPPPLEDLILALLAKDPSTRPTSAAEVLTILEGIDVNAPPRSHSGDSTNPLERLARGVFVGRERELERLRGALDDALAGRGSVVMLVGEAGIGKTRTTQELETYARMRGAKVLWGRAHESSGAPPYWPWVQVARAYREGTPDAEVRRRQYEPYAVELQRIFPALRDLFPTLPEPPSETEEGQFRLFDAFSAFARSVALETPLVFVLDDLHWADGATLALLTHLARELARARILVCGTYRDTDLDRRHPLATALADLGREDLFSRISLRGLSLAETEEYLRQAANVEPARELVARIYEETEGNPFFLSEVVNLMTEEGSFAKDSISGIAVPEGVRQALGRRLDRLSDEANELLTTLAVAGRDFEHALVQSLSAHDDATTLRLLEEALRARVLEEVGAGRYRFTHALMQETLLGELSAARRVLLHGQIAEAMEQLYGDGRDTLAAIAAHFIEASTLNRRYAHAAARYSRLAASQASSAFAYADAATHYERCLAQQADAADSLGLDVAALRKGLGVALLNSGNPRRGHAELDRSIALYRERGDSEGLIRAAIEGLENTTLRPRDEQDALVLEALSLAPSPDLRAELIVRYVPLYFTAANDALAAEARAIAEERGLTHIALQLDHRDGHRALAEGRYEDAIAVLRPLLSTEPVTSGLRQAAFLSISQAELCLGRVDGAQSTFREWEKWARANHLSFYEAVSRSLLGRIMTLRGELGEAKAAVAAAEQLFPGMSVVPSIVVAAARAELHALDGDLEGALTILDVQVDNRGMVAPLWIQALRLRYVLHRPGSGDKDIREELTACLEALAAQETQTGAPNLPALATAVEAIMQFGDDSEVAVALQTLGNRPAAVGFSYLTGEAFDRLRGLLALRVGQLEMAEDCFRSALVTCERERCPIEAGCCHQGLAELAERKGDHAVAMQHLDAAGELFARYGAKLYLDQVLAKKEILKA